MSLSFSAPQVVVLPAVMNGNEGPVVVKVEQDDPGTEGEGVTEDGQPNETTQTQKGLENEIDYKCQLYVRFPCVLPSVEEIKALHPSIIHVFARKHKKPKFCYLAFSSSETALKAMEELSSKPYKDLGHLDVRPKDDHRILPRPGGSVSEKKRWLIVYGLPPTEPDIDVLQEFKRFGCTHAHVHHRDVNEVLKQGSARLVFNTVDDSEAFVANKDLHNYKGYALEVNFLKTGPSKSARQRQRRKQRRKQAGQDTA